MKILKSISYGVFALFLTIPAIGQAAVIFPALEIQNGAGDAGGSFTDLGGGNYDISIDATVFQILTNASTLDAIDIPNQSFTLDASYNGTAFAGNFSVGGGLLAGTFDNLALTISASGTFYFAADLNYTSGSLMTPNITGGRIEGSWNSYNVAAKLGQINPVPVPAAVWLFGSGLLGLVGIARRKTR